MKTSRTLLTALAIGFGLSYAGQGHADEDLYLALRTDRLSTSLGLGPPIPSPGVPNPFSLHTTIILWDTREQQVCAAVYPTVPAATEAFRLSRSRMPVCPEAPPHGEPVGEEFAWWHSSKPATGVLVRRKNIVYDVYRVGSREDALVFVRQIDALIRDDRQIAPLGRFDPPPEIVSVGIPDTLPVGLRVATLPGHFRDVPEESRYRFAPEFRGLGDPARLRVGIYELGRYYDTWNEVTPDGRSRPRIDVTVPTPFPPPLDFSVGARERTPEEDGRFMLKLPLKPGPRRLVMVVVNDDNVVVTKEFQVTFAPR